MVQLITLSKDKNVLPEIETMVYLSSFINNRIDNITNINLLDLVLLRLSCLVGGDASA